MTADDLLQIRGFVNRARCPEPLIFGPHDTPIESETYICHCDDVKLDEILAVIGSRKYISIDEIKHTTRLGMGACRGKRCIVRLKPLLAERGIAIVGEPTPRAPLASPLSMGELCLKDGRKKTLVKTTGKPVEVEYFIAGGGIAGSSLLRYLAEAGQRPVMINFGRGASWRNIAGGRTVFTLPELSEIASENKKIFAELQGIKNIDYCPTQYVTFAHDDQSYRALEASIAWSDARMVEPQDFRREISPCMNPDNRTYQAALITQDCWQASPGKVVDLIRTLGIDKGGQVLEDYELIDVERDDTGYAILVRDHRKQYVTYHARHFVNALGSEAEPFVRKLGYNTGLYAVKHQAFITRRLPFLGVNQRPLGMLIDRRRYKGFTAVYGQQLYETGQIIGCATPEVDPQETNKNLKINSDDFLQVVSEIFVDWIPELSSVGFQAVWAGYYVEPRMVVDPQCGLFVGLRGQGFMLGQFLAKLYIDKLLGKDVPSYFDRLRLEGDGLLEQALK
jgi:glycine/D-amino acid oxidase-like deaminating enzyme